MRRRFNSGAYLRTRAERSAHCSHRQCLGQRVSSAPDSTSEPPPPCPTALPRRRRPARAGSAPAADIQFTPPGMPPHVLTADNDRAGVYAHRGRARQGGQHEDLLRRVDHFPGDAADRLGPSIFSPLRACALVGGLAVRQGQALQRIACTDVVGAASWSAWPPHEGVRPQSDRTLLSHALIPPCIFVTDRPDAAAGEMVPGWRPAPKVQISYRIHDVFDSPALHMLHRLLLQQERVMSVATVHATTPPHTLPRHHATAL